MTADRPTATRVAVPPQRAYSSASGTRQPAPPSDAFSALLGAAAPRADEAPRPAAPRPRRDDAPQRPQRPDQAKPKAAADQPAEAPKAEATEPVGQEAPTEDAPRVVTPDLFALALTSPLAVLAAPVPPTAVPLPGAAVPAEVEATAPAIPAFPTLNLLGAPAPAQSAVEASTAAPTTPTPGGIPLALLAGLEPATQADLSNIELPAAPPAEAPADAVAPQPELAAFANSGGEQPSSDTPSHPQQPNPQAAAPASKPAEAPAPATATQPVAQAAPAAQSVPTSPTLGLQRAVPLYRAPESAAQMIQIAAQRGVTHAKLNLKPVELGGIEVRLQTTPHGVTAQLVADSAEAAKLLTQAADDLRRDLADRDVNLLSLDVTTQQDYQQQQAGSKQADIFGDTLPGGGRTLRVGPQTDAVVGETAASADTTLVLPNGVLVDVLA